MKNKVLHTIGYEKRDIDSFVKLLEENEVEVLVDVRMNAISRKSGFSKTALQTALQAASIDYLHVRDVGNPSEFRKRASTVDECLELYEEHMDGEWDEALSQIIDALQKSRSCLMCYERDHTTCHRTPVARELQARIDDLRVVNL